jgi:hypothetical protein
LIRPSGVYDRLVRPRLNSAVALLPLLATLIAVSPAHADAICGTGGTVSRAGTTATCDYPSVGETSFTVPAGVTSLDVIAIGAPGADGTAGDGFGGTPGTGGRGARVTTTLDVTPGQTLYIEVGAAGAVGPEDCISGKRDGGPGGANGGGAGGPGRCFGYGGGGGGGASDVRTTPASSGGLTGLPGDPRLVVAGGGGGGGSSLSNTAGNGGDAGGAGTGAGAGGDCGTSAADGGTGGIGAGGGAGGACLGPETGQPGAPGDGGTGGNGFLANSGGAGGGGGGYIGGGGGAAYTALGLANGGGGGSSFGPAGTTYASAGAGVPASVTLSFEVPPPTVAIAAPVDGQSFTFAAAATTAFSCTESAAGTGIASCLDGDGRPSGAALDTWTLGAHTLVVTATSSDGRTATRSVSYTVAGAAFFPGPPVKPAAPSAIGPGGEPGPTAPLPLPVVTVTSGGTPAARASRRGTVVVPGMTATCTAGAGPCDDAAVALNATVHGRRVTLGRSVFRLADGASTSRLTVTLSAFGRRVLASKRSLTATAVVTLRNSATTATATNERDIRLLAPRR